MQQLTGTNVGTFETADEAGKITILGSTDAKVPHDCTIKIASWGGRFDVMVGPWGCTPPPLKTAFMKDTKKAHFNFNAGREQSFSQARCAPDPPPV